MQYVFLSQAKKAGADNTDRELPRKVQSCDINTGTISAGYVEFRAMNKIMTIIIDYQLPRPQFLLLSLTMDVSRYTNDNDEKYCYCGTAGDAGRLQHYSLPRGCRKKSAIITLYHRFLRIHFEEG